MELPIGVSVPAPVAQRQERRRLRSETRWSCWRVHPRWSGRPTPSTYLAGGNRFGDTVGTRCPTIAARHFRGDAAFVEKHQTIGVQLAYLVPPGLPPPEVLPAVLFLRPERFF